ncbi:MAG TPA: right-handed parallel beta-helix repeat-containing protein, partial [Roseiflexaceae bacterium]|nr:right-handed parallel beta-helix repeat-containing protein [Roseiflexaceae bacterium]
TKIANTLDGVRIESTGGSASNNKIGDTVAATRNTISGNGSSGIRIRGSSAQNNLVINNLVGLTSAGTALANNTQAGVVIEAGARSNTIGGGSAGQPNVISNNTGDGVSISGTQTYSNTVAGNTIGLSESRLTNLGNTGRAIMVSAGASYSVIGGAGTAGNVIAANNGGVVISGTQTLSATVMGNLIGAKKDGVSGKLIVAAGNTGDGVQIYGASYTRVGAANQGNTIVSNTGNGIRVANAQKTTISSNLIGTIRDGATNLARGNSQNGVQVDSGANTTTITGNTIFFNAQNGVLVRDKNTQQAKISANSISGNSVKGIELDPETTGTSGDPTNPNHDINPPFAVRLNQSGLLTGRVLANTSSAATRASSCIGCTIEIFAADRNTLDRQGRDRINVAVTITSNGYFTTTLPSVPQQIALTATDSTGNTSEFAVLTATMGLAIGPAFSGTAKPGDVITYTHRVTNTGALDFTNLLLSAFSEHNWPYKLTPSGTFALAAGQSREVALTLSLPTGADKRVAAGTVEHTRLTVTSTSVPTATASVTDTTTVLSRIVLLATPLSLNGSGTPGTTIPYAHNITNNGNITATLSITASTDLVGWKTTVTTTTLRLAPGQTAGMAANVTVPTTALITSPPAKTTIRITPV